MTTRITNLEVGQSVLKVFNAELTRLQGIARHGNKDAAMQIVRTMAHCNLALRALGYRLNYEDSEDFNLYPIEEPACSQSATVAAANS